MTRIPFRITVNRIAGGQRLLSSPEEHDVKSLDDMRGKLSQSESDNPELYERLQYIKALVNIE